MQSLMPSVRSIFDHAIEIESSAERRRYVEDACASDPTLRGQVDALLHAYEQAGSFLEKPPPPVGVTIDEFVAEGPGSRIGPYKLLQQIGEGGMGIVYMAEQESPVRRRVALKIIKPGMDSAQIVARFEAERQALALMDHPNIARVFDAGATESGRPFFVMELVHGVPITAYCDENKMSPRDRLGLFVPVCHAIQHAHQKGVIHRDIKPSNVLVTLHDGKPVPKVIDFGVAKATEQRLTERTLFTQFGTMVGTVEYMSPEQAEMSGLGVDTRSDVYSLGVLLYELLTGTTPLERPRLRDAAYDEILRLIRNEEPQRPSFRISSSGGRLASISANRGTEPTQLSRLIRGELDWIVMKCLEKDRTRRYDSASGLARDVEHFLHDEPVEACPPTVGYRLRKFARKYKAILTTAAGFALLLLAGAGASMWQAYRATHAEKAAAHERDEAAHQRDVAIAAEKDAQTQRDQARAASNKLLLAQDTLRATQYAWDMQVIPTAWEASHVSQVVQLLDRHRPKADGPPDLRGFEWHYWNNARQSELRKLVLRPEPEDFAIGISSMSDDCRRIAASTSKKFAPGTPPPEVPAIVKVWNTSDGKEVFTLVLDWAKPGDAPVSVNNLRLSRDGRYLAIAWEDRARTQLPRDRTQMPPTGLPLMTVSNAGLRVFDVETNRQVLEITEPDSVISDFEFAPDSRRFAAARCSREKRDRVFREPPPPMSAVARVWELSSGKELCKLEGDVIASSVFYTTIGLLFSADGSRVVGENPRRAQADPREIRIWDSTTGKIITSWQLPANDYPEYALNPAGTQLAYAPDTVGQKNASASDVITIWDTSTGREIHRVSTIDRLRNYTVSRLKYSSDGAHLAIVFRNYSPRAPMMSNVAIYDTQNWTVVNAFDWKEPITALEFSRDGKRLAAIDGNTLCIHDCKSGEIHVTHRGFRPGRRSLQWTFQSNDQRLGTLEGDTYRELAAINEAPISFPVAESHLSPNGRLVAGPTAGKLNLVGVWEASTGRLLHHFEMPAVPKSPNPQRTLISAMAFSADCRRLAVARVVMPDRRLGDTSAPPTEPLTPASIAALRRTMVFVWDLASGRQLAQFEPSFPAAFALSPSGDQIAISAANSLQLIEIGNQKPIWSIDSTLTGSVGSLAFRPDGQELVGMVLHRNNPGSGVGSVAAPSRSLMSWNTRDGVVSRSVPIPMRRGRPSWSPDGKRIGVLGADRDRLKIHILDWATGAENVIDAGEATSGVPSNEEVVFSPDGRRIAFSRIARRVLPPSQNTGDEIEVRDSLTGAKLLTLRDFEGAAESHIAFSGDGQRLVALWQLLRRNARLDGDSTAVPAAENAVKGAVVKIWDGTPR